MPTNTAATNGKSQRPRAYTAAVVLGCFSLPNSSDAFQNLVPDLSSTSSRSRSKSSSSSSSSSSRGLLTTRFATRSSPAVAKRRTAQPATDHAIRGSSTTALVEEERSRPVETKTTKRSGPPAFFQSANNQSDLLDHRILTSEEEQMLGKKIRKAADIKSRAEQILADRQELASHLFHEDIAFDDFDDEDYADSYSILKGPTSYQDDSDPDDEMRHFATYNLNTESLRKYDSGSMATVAFDYIRNDLDLTDENKDDPDSLGASLYDFDMSNDAPAMAFDQLNDYEIKSILNLEGGRKELNRILLEGAIARDTLIRCNLRLVVSVAKKWARLNAQSTGAPDSTRLSSLYQGGWDRPSLDEAIQEGIIGLTTAADRFEPSRNLKFGTYATHWITSYIRRCFQETSTGCLRIPHNYHNIKYQYDKVVKQHLQTEGKYPALEVVAAELHMTTERLQFVIASTRPLVSIDAPKGGGNMRNGGTPDEATLLLSNILPCGEPQPIEQVELSFLRQCLENAMAAELSPHERDIIRLRLGLDDGVARTAREVAEICGGSMSVTDVRTAEVRAFRKLRSPHAVHTQKLSDYLSLIGEDTSIYTNLN